jgi:hypothetical protein
VYETVVPPAVLGGTIVATDPGVAGGAVARVSGAMLPVTGIAIGGLLVAALVLIVMGVVLRTLGARQRAAQALESVA